MAAISESRRAGGVVRAATAAGLCVAVGGGCVPRDQVGFDAIGPAHRLDAIVLASDAEDEESLCGLVQQLDSDDPAARLLAIRALQKRTGETLEYRYDDPPWKRSQAVDRWVAWVDARAGQPSGDGVPEEGS